MDTCRVIGTRPQILATDDTAAFKARTLGDRSGQLVETCDGFSGVHPELKLQIVQVLEDRCWLTDMTGDGVSDGPALKKANVGIAVEGATDVEQGASAIVLARPWLAVVVEVIGLTLKIFQRMKNYVIYLIACTLQLLVSFFWAALCVDFWNNLRCAGCRSTADHTDHGDIPRYFALPVMAMVLITVLNDGAFKTLVAVWKFDRTLSTKNGWIRLGGAEGCRLDTPNTSQSTQFSPVSQCTCNRP